jgi:hypothetical protein
MRGSYPKGRGGEDRGEEREKVILYRGLECENED